MSKLDFQNQFLTSRTNFFFMKDFQSHGQFSIAQHFFYSRNSRYFENTIVSFYILCLFLVKNLSNFESLLGNLETFITIEFNIYRCNFQYSKLWESNSRIEYWASWWPEKWHSHLKLEEYLWGIHQWLQLF